MAGFEPTAPRSQSECATKLRHIPSRSAASLSVAAIIDIAGNGPRLAAVPCGDASTNLVRYRQFRGDPARA